MFAHPVHMGDAGTDKTARTGLVSALHGASVQCIVLIRDARVVISTAVDGSLIVWPVRPRKKALVVGASRIGEHRQAAATNDDDDEDVEDGFIERGCEGVMLDVKEGRHVGGVSLIVPWGFDFVTTCGDVDGMGATWVVRPHRIELVQCERTVYDRQTWKAKMEAKGKAKRQKLRAGLIMEE